MYFGGRINRTCLEDERERRARDYSEDLGLEDWMIINKEESFNSIEQVGGRDDQLSYLDF